ncbi:MgtC/SapB family protein [Fulvivirgaceae bacterium PWU20]|uniref:MgtC/SapB family protein n=1 Tax=Chryseosolibacter indicus TaxID=2782351 RepID=A0ABS5VUA3_9BACT|nr:MgtC/SapB family protein [Chryseosolibacter indicus]
MRDGLSISGLTTASTIWVAAALGMAVGVGQCELAFAATLFALIVLTAFGYLQRFFDKLHKTIILHIIFDIENNGVASFEEKLTMIGLRYERRKERRKGMDVRYVYEISGSSEKQEALINYLIEQKDKVKAFEY